MGLFRLLFSINTHSVRIYPCEVKIKTCVIGSPRPVLLFKY